MNAVFKVQMAKRAAIIYDLELYRPGGHANYTWENSDICYEVPVHPIHIDDLLSEEGVLPPKHKNRVGKVQKKRKQIGDEWGSMGNQFQHCRRCGG